ncbi:MAG: DUF805 domain-containing protein [Flavobacteriaceae bacterium]|nr:DUF805 domain-containing protein [Flavobacteriaceae bacterium]
MDWYIKVLKQYADFNGRARRKEYWMFVLFNFIFTVSLSAMSYITGNNYLLFIYSVLLFIPKLAVSVRRLHDIGKSGWMYLIAFIPLVGAIWLLVLFVTDSDIGSNEYGENPKGDNIIVE